MLPVCSAVQAWDMKSFHPFRLDAANHSLWRGQERAQIAPKAFDVLRHLVENAGRLVTHEELLEALWPETYVNPEVLRKYILEIRRVLGDRPDKPEFIETVTKRGYRFVASVTDESATQRPNLPAPNTAQELAGIETDPPEREGPSDKERLRKLAVPAMLVVIAAAAITGYFWFARNEANAPALKDTSIVVLPFADSSAGKDEEYFSDGLTEELISNLAKIQGLKVVARSSAFQFKGRNEDLRTVGRKLGVANVLEGSVRKEGNRVRITAVLTKVDDGFQLWSETYDREVSHIFAAQDEIARAVAGASQSKLLSVNFIARGQDKEDLTKALSYAEQAVKLDANYAPAWAQRSLALERLARVGLMDSADGFRRARESAEKAIGLDAGLASRYMTLALVQIDHDWDWEGADASLKEAALLEPGKRCGIGQSSAPRENPRPDGRSNRAVQAGDRT
jgi:TolB-like protein/DNA-binding winged helix-turn-helix (wHTH) protein